MVRLTQEGRDRMERELDRERERLSEADAFLREQMACACDTDAITLRDARLEKARLAEAVDRLESTLTDARILPADRVSSTVELGAVVTLAQRGSDDEMTIEVVEAPDASVASEGVMRISDVSPLGRRLLGLRAGDSVHVPVGERTVTYEVRGLRY